MSSGTMEMSGQLQVSAGLRGSTGGAEEHSRLILVWCVTLFAKKCSIAAMPALLFTCNRLPPETVDRSAQHQQDT